MKDTIEQIYNGFLLRDILGYVVPGSFVLACMAHLVSLISGVAFSDLLDKMPEKAYIYLFIIGLCYACGHFLAGIFFHFIQFNRLFSYTPRELLVDYPGQNWKDAWASHRLMYRNASSKTGGSLQGQIERHAALLHFTGHFSAGIVFVFIYLIVISVIKKDVELGLYSIPLIIIFPGIYKHFKTLVSLRYKQEREVIKTHLITKEDSSEHLKDEQ